MITRLRRLPEIGTVNYRTFKNFGHKRQPTAGVTMLWHGFLTFTFIGLAIEWDKIAEFFIGKNEELFQTSSDEDY